MPLVPCLNGAIAICKPTCHPPLVHGLAPRAISHRPRNSMPRRTHRYEVRNACCGQPEFAHKIPTDELTAPVSRKHPDQPVHLLIRSRSAYHMPLRPSFADSGKRGHRFVETEIEACTLSDNGLSLWVNFTIRSGVGGVPGCPLRATQIGSSLAPCRRRTELDMSPILSGWSRNSRSTGHSVMRPTAPVEGRESAPSCVIDRK
jgi:hypothetical protein